MQISKKLLQTGTHLALFFAVSVAAVSSAQAVVSTEEEASNAAPVVPAKPKPTREEFQAAKNLKGFIGSNWGSYFPDSLKAKKAGIEIQDWVDLSTYQKIKELLEDQEPTLKQFKAVKALKGFQDKSYSLQSNYFNDVLEAQKAGIEIQGWEDLSTYQKIKELLKDQKPTLEQFKAGLTLKGFKDSNWEFYFSDFLGAQEAGIEIKSQDDLYTYRKTKELLGFQSLTPEQFKVGLTLKAHFKDSNYSLQSNYFNDVLEAQKAGIEIQGSGDLSRYRDIRKFSEGQNPTLEQFQAVKNFKGFKDSNWEFYLSDFLKAKKAGIEIQDSGDLYTYWETKKLLGAQSLTPEQFKAGLIIKAHFKDSNSSSQRNYFNDVLEAHKAGIEIQDSGDLYMYRDIRKLLEKENQLAETPEKNNF